MGADAIGVKIRRFSNGRRRFGDRAANRPMYSSRDNRFYGTFCK